MHYLQRIPSVKSQGPLNLLPWWPPTLVCTYSPSVSAQEHDDNGGGGGGDDGVHKNRLFS